MIESPPAIHPPAVVQFCHTFEEIPRAMTEGIMAAIQDTRLYAPRETLEDWLGEAWLLYRKAEIELDAFPGAINGYDHAKAKVRQGVRDAIMDQQGFRWDQDQGCYQQVTVQMTGQNKETDDDDSND